MGKGATAGVTVPGTASVTGTATVAATATVTANANATATATATVTATVPTVPTPPEQSSNEVSIKKLNPVSNETKPILDKEKSVKSSQSSNTKAQSTTPKDNRDHQKSKGSASNNAYVNKSNQVANTKVTNSQTVTMPQPQQQQSIDNTQTASVTIKSNENQEISQSSNGVITNGHQSNGSNNSNNRRAQPKWKWVPLDIELPGKTRGKPRERNNNTTQRPNMESSTRSQPPASNQSSEYVDREPRTSRRYGSRPTDSRRGTHPSNGSTHPSSKPISNTVRPNLSSNPSTRPMNPTAVNTRRSGPIRSGVPKSTRVNRIINHHHNQNGLFN